jgi:purine-binding chemotaxis protein CheW
MIDRYNKTYPTAAGNGRQYSSGKTPGLEPQNGKPGSDGPAAASLEDEELSQEVLANIWARRAYVLAEEPPVESTGQTVDLLVFKLGNERYGLEVSNAREIYPLEQLTAVPRTPDFVAGVFNARGRILSVINLRAFLGLPETGFSDQTKIIVVTNTDPNSETAYMEIGLLADEVVDVVTLYREAIEPPLTAHTGSRAEYIQGVTADLLVVLDLNALLSDEHLIVQEELI